MKKTLIYILFLLISTHSIAQDIYISDISISGNKITKDYIIMRELPFRVGESYSTEQLEILITKARENLLNTSLFNYVTIEQTEQDESFKRAVNILVEERWYWWPMLEAQLEDRNLSSWLKKMDYDRITYNMGMKVYNLFGLGHKAEVVGRIGYERGIDLKYSKIALNKEKTKYLSAEAYATFNKSLDYITRDNKPLHTKSDHVLKRNFGVSATLSYRPHYRTKQEFIFSFNFDKVADSVLIMNPNYWGVEGRINRNYEVAYNYIREYRNYIYYPTSGFYLGFSLKMGESNRFKFVYSNFSSDFQYYKPISERWYWGTSAKASISAKNHKSYLHDNAVGYGNINITGYELYTIDGQHYITLNNSIKYNLLSKKIVHLHFIRNWNRFNKPFFSIYLKLMHDMGYVYQTEKTLARVNNNNYTNKFLFGSGVGIDIVSYYDIVINIGYSVNSKGKGNFVFGFRAPIF